MKIALVTDTHAGARNDSNVFADHFKRFYSEMFFPYLDAHDIKHCIHLGDMFDRRKYVNFMSLQGWHDMFLSPLRERNISTHVIVGNHDAPYRNTLLSNSPSLLLQGYDNITVVDTPMEVDYDGISIALIPWICQNNAADIQELCRTTKALALMGHLELHGFEMYAGQYMQEGLGTDWLERFRIVMSGHYHHKSSKGNINYLGAPYDMSWSDYGSRRGFHVFDTETYELEFIVNPHTLYHKLWYDDSQLTTKSLNDLDFSDYSGKIVKVIVKVKDNHFLFDTYIEKLTSSGADEVDVVEDHMNYDITPDEIIIDQTEDTLSIIDSYISDDIVGRDKLINLMADLHRRALEIDDRI